MPNRNIVKGNIGNALHSVAPDHITAVAEDVFDEGKQMYQNDINSSQQANVGYFECNTAGDIAAKEVAASGYVLNPGGSIKVKMVNINSANNVTLNINSTGAKTLYYEGERASNTNTWNDGETIEIYYDGTNFYANNVAGGGGDGVFDVSAKYPTSGVDGGNTYTLGGALAVLNTNLSSNKKKGGMSIKFVQSSDNKYVQFRLMSDTFSTTESDWQGVESNVVENSKNLVEGGAVFIPLHTLNQEVNGGNNYTDGGYIAADGYTIIPDSNYSYSDYIDLSAERGNTLIFWHGGATNGCIIFYDAQRSFIDIASNTSGSTRSVSIPNNCTYVRFSFLKNYDNTKINKAGVNAIWRKEFVKGLKDNKLEVSASQSLTDSQKQIALSNLGLPTTFASDIANLKTDVNRLEESLSETSVIANDALGDFTKTKSLVVSSHEQVIYPPTIGNFGKRVAVRLNSMECTFNSGKGITIAFYPSEGSAVYKHLIRENQVAVYESDVNIEELYITVLSNSVASPGDVEMEVFYGNGYTTYRQPSIEGNVAQAKEMIETANGNSKISIIEDELNLAGRLILRHDLPAVQNKHQIAVVTKDFGTKIAFRVVYNEATLSAGAKIKAAIYNNGSAFYTMEISDEWVTYDSSIFIEGIYVFSDGEISNKGTINIEVAYGDYYDATFDIVRNNLGTVSLPRHGSESIKTFNPIEFARASSITVTISDLTLEEEDDYPEIYIYGVYSKNGNSKGRLGKITKQNKVFNVYSFGKERLYGLYFWNALLNYGVEFKAEVNIKYSEYTIPTLVPFDDVQWIPSYYNEYLPGKVRIIRELMNNSIIDGDVFYFITDTHWEWNTRHSPALIKELNKTLSIPRLFHGGDVYHDGIRDDGYSVDCLNQLRRALHSDKVYAADGNHEYILNNGVGATYGDVFCEARIFLDDVVFGGENKNYYYVNNNQKKIRYIILASFGQYVGGSITYGFVNQNQLTWFSNIALDVEEGWDIIIFCHFIVARSSDGSGEEINGASNIYNIIDNYQGNGNILACITGHTHWDVVMQNKCKCPIVCTTCDHNFPFKMGSAVDLQDLLIPRNSGSVNEQAFDVVVYNKESMLLNFVRIGSQAMNRSNSYDGNAQVDIRTVLINNLAVSSTMTISSPFTITSWESSDSTVASVSDGTITANAAGYAVITGTSASNEKQSWFIKIV